MEFLQNIRQNLFNTSANQPQQGQGSTFIQRLQDPRFLGLLAGAAATQRLGAAQGLQEGAKVMAAYQGLDEQRKRKLLVQKLVSEGGFTQQEQALILASQNPASVAAQIRTQKQAAARPQSNIGQLASDLQKGIISQEDFDDAMAKATYTTPVKPSALQEKSDLLKSVGILPGTEKYNESMFNIKKDKQSAFAEKEAALKTAGFEVGSAEYNQALFNIKDDKPSVFQEKITQLTNENVEVGSAAWNQALYGITPKAPKSASLVNLIAKNDFVIDGKQVKAGEVIAYDQATQQDKIVEAANLGAIIAPSKVENITGGADTGDQPPAISPVSPIDIKQAAGGDIAGFAKDFFNFVGGVTMLGEPATARRDEQTNIAALENAVLPGLVRSISSTGAVRTQEGAKKLIPNIRDSDNKMSSKVNALIPVLQQKLQEADNVLKSPGKITASQRTLATQITSTYPQIISAMQLSKDRYEKRNSKSETQKKADKILEELK